MIEATLVAVDDHDHIRGLVIVSADEVFQLAVDRRHRRSGVGAALLTAAEKRIAAAHDRAWMAVVPGNYLHARGVELLRPAYRNRAARPGQALLAPIRQLIESVNDTLKGQLDLELHGGRSLAGVTARVAQRLLALTAAIWHNRATGQPVTRSLIAYDH